ncbi:MAG TPA: carboxypeptidase-like regulatory domain-containing protein [Actinophytocola sp.]|jgi:hypothetical protein|uniref:MSCRAMM family protein n=1 Tax=Actinophytocola sp. TaxID=1872138 RepID=UPI002E01677D|nr:carboxypeptidase-like regulatory domain-containing protein [Actinophytocola sp.]
MAVSKRTVWGQIQIPHALGGGRTVKCTIAVLNGRGSVIATDKVNKNGKFKINLTKIVKKPAQITVRAGTCRIDGHDFLPEHPTQTVRFDPNAPFDKLTIGYGPAFAEVQATAWYKAAGGKPQPLPGAKIELFRGRGTTKVLRTVTTSGGQPTRTLDELKPGWYTVVISGPAEFAGFPVVPVHPQDSRKTVRLKPGDVIAIARTFRSAGAVVEVRVVNQEVAGAIGKVPVLLESTNGIRHLAKTKTSGIVTFPPVPPGAYFVQLAEPSVTVDGRKWILSSGPQIVTIGPGSNEAVALLQLVADTHEIFGTVRDPKGNPIPHMRLIVRRFPDRTEMGDLYSDDTGNYRFIAPAAGTYTVSVKQQNGVPERATPITVNSSTQHDVLVDGSSYPDPPPTNDGTKDALTEFQAFPVMVGEVDIGGPPAGRGGGGASGGSTGQIVESALKDILGWRPRTQDPRGFVAALTQSFSCKEVQGHRECTWTPRGYAASIQADLGALTGAQASIYERAKIAIDAALPILERIKPLAPDADEEDTTATRRIIRSRLTEIPKELGAEGGPRVQRVDELFLNLFGIVAAGPINAETVVGELGAFRERLGLTRNRINTIDEEANFTDFLMLVDHVGTLFNTWQNQRDFFDRDTTGTPFLGTQLVLMSRQLEVVTETVNEASFVMDSVFLGAAERQTVLLKFPAAAGPPALLDEPSLTVAELLDWVERFASEEGPQLITDGGVDGVRAFAPTIERLAILVRRARPAPDGQQTTPQVPPSYLTARVRQALAQLQQQLEAAFALAQPFTQIARP